MKPVIRRMFATTYVTGEPVEIRPDAHSDDDSRPAKRSAVQIVTAALLAAIFVAAVGIYIFMRPATLKIAVGPAGSDDARLVQVVAQVLSRDRGNVRLKIVPTDGATASAAALDKGGADMAVVRGDLELPKSAQSVAILRKNVVVMWAPGEKPAKKVDKKGEKKPAAKPIEKIEDLAGRRIGVIGRTKANVELLNVILRQYNVDPDKVAIAQMSVAEATEAIRNAKADAFLAAGPVASRVTLDAIAASTRSGPIKFLAIDAADAIAARVPAYEATEISEGAFGSAPERPDEAIKTIGFSHYIVAAKSAPEQTITDFARALFTARQTIALELPNVPKIEAPDTDKDAALPAHPGAAAYIDGDEKTFFDRYSDLLYWGLMALSAVGSAGAWFASYLRRDESGAAIRHRAELFETMQAARSADNMADLDALQAQADELLRQTLEALEANLIDETALNAFSIVLNQTHSAIAERRAALSIRLAPEASPTPA